MPGVGDDQLRVRVRVDEPRRWSAIGGRPRPPWMRIGTRRSAESRKIGASRSSFSMKRCARGWSLIPRAPRSSPRRASSSGSSVRSSRTNGISRPVRALRERERAVVRRAERRLPVGLVEAEHERPGDAVLVHAGEELVEAALHPVDVVPEVDVRVEDVGALGQLARSSSS